MMRGHDNLSVNDQMEDLRERMRLLQGDRKVSYSRGRHSTVRVNIARDTTEGISTGCVS